MKFKNRGKVYFFDPHGIAVRTGEKVVVETSRGLELAECVQGSHAVPDETVVQPLRSLARIATKDDLRIEEINRRREKEAFAICKQKIAEHGLDMKLVDVECSFEGNKTMFFFTSDGRVDFRELVKDLASVFRNRIELRQIGVRDEAKMLGGIGICGRPYCCSQFLDDFQPVSTKMAKVQSMSLNPSKISGACGRLMCCLRYEQAAYEELVKAVPKVGAFVETPAGYGTVSSVNILRSSLKVKLDGQGEDVFKNYQADEIAVVIPALSAQTFDISNAITDGNYDAALRKLQDLYAMQTEPILILGAIGSQLRRLLYAKTVMNAGQGQQALMELTGMKSYPAGLTMNAARRIGDGFCRRAVELCLQADRDMKASRDDPERVLEVLLAALAQEARSGTR